MKQPFSLTTPFHRYRGYSVLNYLPSREAVNRHRLGRPCGRSHEMNTEKRIMNTSKPLLLLLSLAFLSGCGASNAVSYKNNINGEISSLAKKYAKSDSNKYEIIQPIEHVFSFLKTSYSDKQWQKLSKSHCDTTRNLETYIQEIYGKSLYRIAGGEMQFKDKYPFDAYTELDTFTVGFVKVIAPNRIPDNEKGVIVSQLNKYTQKIAEILSEDTELKYRFEYGLSRMSNNGKIELILATNQYQAKHEGLKMNYAISKIGYYQSVKTPDSAVFTTTIATKYFGLISTSTFLHELVHSVVGIIQSSPNNLVIPFGSISNLQKTIDAISDSSQDMIITEGLAESISQSFNPMYNSGYFNAVDKNVVWQEKLNGELHDIESAGKCYNSRFCSFDGRILALYQAHSFVNHLVKEYGYSRVLRLATCSPNDSNYISILGKSKNMVYEDWVKKIKKQATL
ncbi:MAG: hypothetical protein IPO40_23690 [Fibrobacteres bacterium]|nr:hypothetical protein [Fibrobacterota bacterium]